ncbi:BTAD domain-containing putative transcriptional regulator [Streptomyces sp. NPDC089919]|uniref:AfsR/SARP family transcriptional regulator n=1 Tax=Streptomyces sp. NPDC089919 TaxID=3155188 RepID=UPI0034162084
MAERDGPGVRFNVLGSLEAWADDSRLRLGGPIQERVLVTLLLEPGRVVPVPRLVEAAWEDEPPDTASHQIRKAVADLRQRIPGGRALLVTDGAGYRAVLTEGTELDLVLFTRHLQAAREALAAEQSDRAEAALRSALELWRGPVLSGAGGPVIGSASTALEERRMAAAEQLYELLLERGQAAELIGDLRESVAAHPLRETLRGHLMLALYRSGRQAEALEEFGRVRELLVEELGVDPGPALSGLYEAILRDGPELAGPRPAQAAHARPPTPTPAPRTPVEPPPAPAAPAVVSRETSGTAGVPCTLPYDLTDFTGREQELKALLATAGDAADAGTRILAVDGMGGTGKTSLAVRASHLLAVQYPDGQLHIDLRGYTPGEHPLEPGAVLASLLRTLGVSGDQIPEDAFGRAALWRTTLVGRRLLLLFDNASDAAQVRPLLPASPGCLVLVTSRARLVELDGAEWISLGVMSPDDSRALITETLGRERTEREPAAADELAVLCGHLPLALRIATARLRNRSRWTVQHLVDRLRDETRLLDELSSGERSVAATLRLSYQAMDEEHRSAFRLLSLHPGAEVDVYSAGALLGTDPRDAEDLLEDLLDMHLVQQHELGFYAFHDLVRSFAQSLRNAETAAEDRESLERLLDYFYAASDAACALLFPGRLQYDTGLTSRDVVLPPLKDAEQAASWFDHEADALAAAIGSATPQGLPRHAVYTGRNLMFFLNMRSYMERYRKIGEIAIAAARRLNDPVALRMTLTNQVSALWRLGRFRDAIPLSEEALEQARAAGERSGEGACLEALGLLHSCLGQLAEGLRYQELAVSVLQETGVVQLEINVLCSLCSTYSYLGRLPEAVSAAERALARSRQLGSADSEVSALNCLAGAHLERGAPGEAEKYLTQALTLFDESRRPDNFALSLALMAAVRQHFGQVDQAVRCEEQALELLSRQRSVRHMLVERLLGGVHMQRGDLARALEFYESALDRAMAAEYGIEKARSLAGIARVSAALGDAARAEECRARAVRLFEEMGVPEEARQPL